MRKNISEKSIYVVLIGLFCFCVSGFAQTTITLGASDDASISEYIPNSNYGSGIYLESHPWEPNNSKRFLIKFDFSSIPTNATITSADLKLTVTGTLGYSRTLGTHLITSSWDEASVTWASFSDQYNSTTGATATFTYPTSTEGIWDLTADVQSIIEGQTANNGWLVLDENEDASQNYWYFASKEFAATGSRPELTLTYEETEDPGGDPIVVNATQTNIICYGQNNGTASVNPTGGTGSGFLYDWTPNPIGGEEESVSSAIGSLTPGTWSLLITDVGDPQNQATVDFIITEPNVLHSDIGFSSPSCNTCEDGSIANLCGGGLAPYTYSFDDGQTFQNEHFKLNQGAGYYNLVVKDANNCELKVKDYYLAAEVFSISGQSKNTSCATPTGEIDATIYGGSPPFSFQWSNGEATEDIIGLGIGVYQLTVTDNDGNLAQKSFEVSTTTGWTNLVGCEINEDGNLMNNNSVPWGSAKATSNGIIPAGEDGEFSVVVSGGRFDVGLSSLDYGGSPFIEYRIDFTSGTSININEGWNWKAGEWGLSIGSIVKMEKRGLDIIVTADGTEEYRWTLPVDKDLEIRCQPLDANVELTGFSSSLQCSDLSLSYITQASDCEASTGLIDLTIHGGTSPYVVSWSNSSSSEDLSNISNGYYSVTITDAMANTTSAIIRVGAIEYFTWENLENIIVNGNELESTTGTDWQSFAYSNVIFKAGETGSIEYNVPNGFNSFMFGLSSYSKEIETPAGSEYVVAKYPATGFEIRLDRASYYPQGNTFFTNNDDVLKITKENNAIVFFLNNLEVSRIDGNDFDQSEDLRMVFKIGIGNTSSIGPKVISCSNEIKVKQYFRLSKKVNGKIMKLDDSNTLGFLVPETYLGASVDELDIEIVDADGEKVASRKNLNMVLSHDKKRAEIQCVNLFIGQSKVYLLVFRNKKGEEYFLQFLSPQTFPIGNLCGNGGGIPNPNIFNVDVTLLD